MKARTEAEQKKQTQHREQETVHRILAFVVADSLQAEL